MARRRTWLRLLGTGVAVPLSGVESAAGRSVWSVSRTVSAGSTQAQQAKLTAPDAGENHLFGDAVAATSGTIVVGATNATDATGESRGAVYVFERRSNEWAEPTKLVADDVSEGSYLGRAVAIAADGQTVLAGAPRDERRNGHGSAHVFERGPDEWVQRATITPGAEYFGDRFGRSVALGGETAVVGMPIDDGSEATRRGTAYVFERSDGGWRQQAKLVAPDGDELDYFGWSVAVAGNGQTVLVGAQSDEDPNGSQAGSAYVFDRRGDEWQQVSKLAAEPAGRFGRSVSLSTDGDTALIGAPAFGGGAAFVFERGADDWQRRARLTADDGDGSDGLGESVALDSGVALVGAFRDEDPNGRLSGSAYVFERGLDGWSQWAKITASGGSTDENFGRAVGLAGTTAVVGTPWDADPGAFHAGSAYVFDLSGVAAISGDGAQTTSESTTRVRTVTPTDATRTEAAADEPERTTSEDGAGFGITSALAGIGGVYLLNRIRRVVDRSEQ